MALAVVFHSITICMRLCISLPPQLNFTPSSLMRGDPVLFKRTLTTEVGHVCVWQWQQLEAGPLARSIPPVTPAAEMFSTLYNTTPIVCASCFHLGVCGMAFLVTPD